MTLSDIQQRKEITVPDIGIHDGIQDKTSIEFLSVKLTEALPSIPYSNLLEKKALNLLNNPGAIVPSPTTAIDLESKRCFAGSATKCNPKFYSVSISKNNNVVCTCRGFPLLQSMQSFSCSGGEEQSIGGSYKKNKISSRSAITYPTNPGGSGRKGKASRRNRSYSAPSNDKESSDDHPFTKVWHNNEPLIICEVDTIPKDKNNCAQRGNEFPRGTLAIIPFDIAVSHRERSEYFNQNRKSHDEPLYLQSPPNRMTTKHYCIKKDCILRRFPYFKTELVEVSNRFDLKEGHKKLLRKELGLQI